jgi:hypothetical protein
MNDSNSWNIPMLINHNPMYNFLQPLPSPLQPLQPLQHLPILLPIRRRILTELIYRQPNRQTVKYNLIEALHSLLNRNLSRELLRRRQIRLIQKDFVCFVLELLDEPTEKDEDSGERGAFAFKVFVLGVGYDWP